MTVHPSVGASEPDARKVHPHEDNGDKGFVINKHARMTVTRGGRVKMLHERSIRSSTWSVPRTPSPVEIVPEKIHIPTEVVNLTTALMPRWQDQGPGEALPRSLCTPEPFETHEVAVIEFDVAEVLASEDEQSVQVPLRRVGNTDGQLECPWTILNGNIPDRVFKGLDPRHGTAVFENGKDTTQIYLPMAYDPTWNVEAIYFASLDRNGLRTSSAAKPILGASCTIPIYFLNSDLFPCDMPAGASMTRVVWGFLREIYAEQPKKTLLGIFLSSLPALEYYLSALALEGLVNCAAQTEEECTVMGVNNDTHWILGVYAIFYVLICVFGLVRNRLKWQLALISRATRRLRTSMFSTMLQLSQESKKCFDEGDVAKALDTQVQTAVRLVWSSAFQLWGGVIQLIFKLTLTIQIAAALKNRETKVIIICSTPLMTLIAAVILLCRSAVESKKYLAALEAEEVLSAFVHMSDKCSPAILNYKKGWEASKTFEILHSRYNKYLAWAEIWSMHSDALVKMCANLIFVVIVVVGGKAARDKNLEIGSFVILMRAVRGFESTLENDVSKVLSNMVIGHAAVCKLREILNKDTRRQVRWKRKRRRNNTTVVGKACADCDIVLTGVMYTYPGSEDSLPAVPPTTLRIPKGHLICFPRRFDKAVDKIGVQTLFKLIAGDFPPSQGSITYPARWRVMNLPQLPVLFDGTLMYNLLYGNPGASSQLARDVCQALHLSKELLDRDDFDDFDVESNGDCLKFSDKLVVCLSRALMYDVDLLLIPHALDVLGEEHTRTILKYLRSYIQNRGLVGSSSDLQIPSSLRHYKTVLYTTKFSVSQEDAICSVKFCDVTKFDSGHGDAKGWDDGLL